MQETNIIGEKVKYVIPNIEPPNYKSKQVKQKIEKFVHKNKILYQEETKVFSDMVKYNRWLYEKGKLVNSRHQENFEIYVHFKEKFNIKKDSETNEFKDEEITEELLSSMMKLVQTEKKRLKRFEEKIKLFKKSIKSIRTKQKKLDTEYSVKSIELQKLIEVKEPEPILTRIMKLPDELIRMIKTFLPYTVKNNLILSKYNLSKTIYKLDPCVLQRIFQDTCSSKKIKTVMTRDAFIAQCHHINHHLNPKYSPYWRQNFNSKHHRDNFLYLIYLLREKNPEYAYRILKTICTLFKPNNRYWVNWRMPYYFQPIMIE
jgi:hypothetical protein